ncbi:MAG: iron chaperone [Ktedonobacterales bacterium]
MPANDTKATMQPAKTNKGFSDEERAAIRQRAKEQKAEAEKSDGEQALRAAIAAMPTADRTMAERLHAIITASAPTVAPKTWYGQPAYAREGKIICFFQPASKFKTRYATLGFNDSAQLDDGAMWPVYFALKELTAEVEQRIRALVKKAAS